MAAEWSKSMSMKVTLANLITARVMVEAAISGWRTSDDESYPDPLPGKIVVFEDFYRHGFGNPCHPFLRKLCDYYRISICNLHPNSVPLVSIFITLCELFLGIQPHFNLWKHFFYLKKKVGVGGSKVARGAYLNLHDVMKAEYLNVPLSSSMRDWYNKSKSPSSPMTLHRSPSSRRAGQQGRPVTKWYRWKSCLGWPTRDSLMDQQ
jgi:hypothetical protein